MNALNRPIAAWHSKGQRVQIGWIANGCIYWIKYLKGLIIWCKVVQLRPHAINYLVDLFFLSHLGSINLLFKWINVVPYLTSLSKRKHANVTLLIQFWVSWCVGHWHLRNLHDGSILVYMILAWLLTLLYQIFCEFYRPRSNKSNSLYANQYISTKTSIRYSDLSLSSFLRVPMSDSSGHLEIWCPCHAPMLHGCMEC